MEVGLFIIAAIVAFVLYRVFQDYMKNPIVELRKDEVKDSKASAERLPPPTPKERLMNSEHGLMLRILSRFNELENKSHPMPLKIVEHMIDDMLEDSVYPRDMFEQVYSESKNDDIVGPAEIYCHSTKGEYKKKLKLIEIMFACAYADEVLGNVEDDAIRDVANILHIDDEDFTKIREEFERAYSHKLEFSVMQSLLVMDLKHGYSKVELDDRFHELTRKYNHRITDHRNLGKSFLKHSGNNLREVNAAYRVLLRELDQRA